MGILKKVKDKIVETYQKADTALGGYLPGGTTPAEVKASNTTPAPAPATAVAPPPTNNSYTGNYTQQTNQSIAPTQSAPTAEKPSIIDKAKENFRVNTGGGSREALDASRAGEGDTLAGAGASKSSYIELYGEYQFPIGSKEGLKERRDNVVKVLNASFNPFNKSEVNANVEEGFGKNVLEAASNHPYAAAALIAGAATAVTSAYTAIQSSNSIGEAISTGKIGQLSKTGWNTLKTKSIGDIVLDAATLIDANKAWALAGLSLFGMGVGVAFMNARNQAQVYNDGGDVVQALSIGAGELRDANLITEAEEIEGLIYDTQTLMDVLTNEKDGILKNFKDVKIIGKDKIDKLAESARIQAEAFEKKRLQDLADKAVEQKILDGTATEEEVVTFRENNPDPFAAQDKLRKEEQAQEKANELAIDTQRLDYGNQLAQYILDNRLTAEQIINDPTIRAFALDPNNQFSAVTKLYTEAITATGRGNFYGADGGGQGTIEPASTLGFGLLNTGSEYKDAEVVDESVAPAQSLNDLALETFGIPYAQLTEAQKATLE